MIKSTDDETALTFNLCLTFLSKCLLIIIIIIRMLIKSFHINFINIGESVKLYGRQWLVFYFESLELNPEPEELQEVVTTPAWIDAALNPSLCSVSRNPSSSPLSGGGGLLQTLVGGQIAPDSMRVRLAASSLFFFSLHPNLSAGTYFWKDIKDYLNNQKVH